MLTEAQKDSTMKVDEPKTPFIRYDAETDVATIDGKYCAKFFFEPQRHIMQTPNRVL